METDMVARRWANELLYNGTADLPRYIGPEADKHAPELVTVVRDAHARILGTEEPLNPWLMQQCFYILEAISNDEDDIRRAITTAVVNGPDKDPAALEAWASSHVIYQSFTTRIMESWASTRSNLIQAAQATVIGELANVLHESLQRWGRLLDGLT